MKLTLYRNTSDDRVINKILVSELTLEGTLKDASSLMNPVIIVDRIDPVIHNYAFIPEFRRYYKITEVTSIRTGLWEVSMACDVLMSFRGDILRLYAIVDKQTDTVNGNEYIDDSSLVTDSTVFTRVFDFPNGFLDTPEYILITAG